MELNEKKSVVSYVLAIWLSGIFIVRLYIQIALNEQGVLPIIIQFSSLLWPIIFFLINGRGILPKGVSYLEYVMIFLFFLSGLLSCFVSPIPYVSLGFLIATLFGIYVAIIFGKNCRKTDFIQGLKIFSIIIIIILIAYAKYDFRSYSGYRLGEGTDTMNPNQIAMIALSGVVAVLVFKSLIIRCLLLAPLLVVIYLSGSRAAAVSTILCIMIFEWNNIKYLSTNKKIFIFIPLFLLTTFALIAYWDIVYYHLNSFFLWDDKHRGISSGGSGRTVVWGWMIDLIKENLIIGVGYRAHAEFIKASSSHNGYLALLAEVGILGFFPIMSVIIARFFLLFKLFNNSKDQLLSLFFGLFVSYLALAMFERYLLNIGNPASLLFMTILFIPKKKLLDFSTRKLNNHPLKPKPSI